MTGESGDFVFSLMENSQQRNKENKEEQRGTVTYLLTFRPARGKLSACLAWPESLFRVSRTTLFSAAIRHRRTRMFSSLMTTAGAYLEVLREHCERFGFNA